MKFDTVHTIEARREKVFAAITDPEVLQKCIEGCEKIVMTGEDVYDAHLKIGVAGLKGNYVGKIQLKEKSAPESYTLVVDGKGAPGFVKATARVHLHDKGERTELECKADAQVGGMIAAVGSRLIEAAAKKMSEEFFRKFAAHVKAGGGS